MLCVLSGFTLCNDTAVMVILTINKFADKQIDKKQCELVGQVFIFCKLILLTSIIPRNEYD